METHWACLSAAAGRATAALNRALPLTLPPPLGLDLAHEAPCSPHRTHGERGSPDLAQGCR